MKDRPCCPPFNNHHGYHNGQDQHEYLDRAGVIELATSILDTVNTRLEERIVNAVNITSDKWHIPNAAAVYRAIVNRVRTSIKTVIGNINDVPVGERFTNVIYLQKPDKSVDHWHMYIWNPEGGEIHSGEWIDLGKMYVDLSQYWSRSEVDIADLRTALGLGALDALGDTKHLKRDIENLMADVADIIEDLPNKANSDDFEPISAENIVEMIANIMAKTDELAQ